MIEILKSASKIVFIILAAAAVVGFFTGHLGEENFMILAGMAFSFYFAHKGDNSQPFAGK